jgi:dTDP-4-dehydrorhamnose 3,5-epimerase
MRVLETDIADIKLLKPVRHVDSKEFFSEVFEEGELVNHRIDIHFVQEHQTWSASKGVVRGLHFQSAQARLSGVTTGSIFDIAVNTRRGSSSFGRHVSAVLGAVDWNRIFIPEGFAHGYCTLEPDTDVIHPASAYLLAQARSRPPVNDPALSIARPVSASEALVSDRDRAHPVLSRLPRYFRHEPPINSEVWGR